MSHCQSNNTEGHEVINYSGSLKSVDMPYAEYKSPFIFYGMYCMQAVMSLWIDIPVE